MSANSRVARKIIGTKDPNVHYTERESVRVVAYNATGQIALIHARRENYYKLPGGGIEADEDHTAALQREMLEETGALVKVREGGIIGSTEEYRHHIHQVSYCYRADVVSDTGAPSLTEEELEDELQHQWVSIEVAKELMTEAKPTSTFGKSVKERDIYLLEKATE